MKRIKQKIMFIWGYLTDSSFRNWVDMCAAQKYVNDIQRMFREKQEYEAKKLFGDDHIIL